MSCSLLFVLYGDDEEADVEELRGIRLEYSSTEEY